MKTAISIFAFIGSAAALCPGDTPCSSNGHCGEYDRCTCFAGYTGQDCSQRTCNHHVSWNAIHAEAVESTSDKSGGNFYPVSHSVTECSSKGDCDRDSGECKCFDGYTGKGCRRMQCDGGSTCSGHGQCRSLKDINSDYDGWDKNMIQACECDPGWSGVSCMDRLCPVGDDPLSTGQANHKVYLGTGKFADGANDGSHNNAEYTDNSGTTDYVVPALEFVLKYTDGHQAEWYTWAISAADTSAIAIEEALEALPNHAIPDVTVTEIQSEDDTATVTLGDQSTTISVYRVSKIFEIEFVHARNSGSQSLEVLTTGCDTQGCQVIYIGSTHTVAGPVSGAPNTIKQPEGSGAKIYDAATGDATTAFSISTGNHAITAVRGTKEATSCSGRGTCDTEKGMCECFNGYTGNACEEQTTIV